MHFITFGPENGSPVATNVVLGVLVVIRFSMYSHFFISQPIVLKLWLQIGDTILGIFEPCRVFQLSHKY